MCLIDIHGCPWGGEIDKTSQRKILHDSLMEEKAGIHQYTDLNDIVVLEPEHKGKMLEKHERL